MRGTIRTTLLIVCALSTGCGGQSGGKSGSQTGDSATLGASRQMTSSEILEVPETGVQLGWGYNAYDAAALPNHCVVFSVAEEPAQTRTMTMKEVTDTYELQQRMNVSAEASVKAMGVEGKGKASFAKDVNLSGSSIHFLLDASVDNGVRYAAPFSSGQAGSLAAQNRGPSVRLTQSAANLAKQPEEFLRQCGTGYVSAIYSGAQIHAVVSMSTSSRAEKQDIRAEVEAKGWGATASTAIHNSTSTSAYNSEKNITVLMVGGRGDSIPKDQQELEAKLQTLSYAAYEAPKDFRMAVTPYEALPNWPREHELNGDSGEMEQLAGLYGDYTTLYDEIEHTLLEPALFAALARSGDSIDTRPLVDGESGESEQRYLESLQDYVQRSLRRLESLAIACLSTEQNGIEEDVDCVFAENEFVSSYGLRSQMPVQYPLAGTETIDPRNECSDLQGDENTRCQKRLGLVLFQQKLAGEQPLDRYAADRWILSKSRSRCRLDIVDSGCLSNEAVRDWQQKVGMRLLIVDDVDDQAKLADLSFDAADAAWVTPDRYAEAIKLLDETT